MNSKTILHKIWFTLTVSESKRLIALGLKNNPKIKSCFEDGTIVIAKGTTNTYVAEILAQAKMANGDYVNGHILPANAQKHLNKVNVRPEIILKNGKISELIFPSVLDAMNSNDIILKGANIINYEKKQAGIIIVHPTGGTCGAIEKPVLENNIKVIIPVSLEKDCSCDIKLLSEKSKDIKSKAKGDSPYIWHLEGEIFTEIEALKTFADIDILIIGKGGVGGAEGSVSFAISGTKENIDKAMDIVKSVQGEKEYIK